jgi:hypothetical protein
MAKENKINKSDGKYKLGGSKDTDLEDLDDSQYDVFDSDKNLAEAQSKFQNIDWFACFTIKDKAGNPVGTMPAYTIKFDKPASGNLYYYTPDNNGTANPISYSDTDKKGKKNRVKATLTIGDPPIGLG